jgi:hypothetical protein
MKPIGKQILIIVLLAAVLGTAAIIIADPAAQTIHQDTDGNGHPEEYRLADNQLQIYENNRLLWQSPDDWDIRQIILADADNDHRTELIMVLWKHGSYGEIKPFWFKGEDEEYSCHLFLYRMRTGKLTAVWCSSALINPIIKMTVADSDNNGLNELHVLEGPPTGFAYPLRQLFQRQETSWIWNGWGFERME